MPDRKLPSYPCPVCKAMITGVTVKEEDVLESKRSPAIVPVKCPRMHDIILYVDKAFIIRDAEPLVDAALDFKKCPYCDFQGSPEEVLAHVGEHVLSVNAKIDEVTVDYKNKVTFVHVVIGEGGNAKGVDVAVPLPLAMKILGKVVIGSISFSLFPD
jgi:hypothetical protein